MQAHAQDHSGVDDKPGIKPGLLCITIFQSPVLTALKKKLSSSSLLIPVVKWANLHVPECNLDHIQQNLEPKFHVQLSAVKA